MKQEAPITLRMTPGLKEELLQIANGEDRSVSATIRRAIRGYIDQANEAKVQAESVLGVQRSQSGLL